MMSFFFSCPSFLSYGPWYSCQAFQNLVVPSICICFGFDPPLLEIFIALILMLLELYFFQFHPSPHLI
jgi:hypothetical protein